MLKEKLKMMNGVLENGNYQLDQLEFVEKTNLEDHKSTHVKKTVKSGNVWKCIGDGYDLNSTYSCSSGELRMLLVHSKRKLLSFVDLR